MKQLNCIGGDRRMYFAVKALVSSGYSCKTYHVPGFEDDFEITDAPGIYILPYPSYKDGRIVGLSSEEDQALGLVSPGNILIGGHFPAGFSGSLPPSVRVNDVSASENYLMCNAALTAEGALMKALEAFPGKLHGCKVLVCGSGRIGKHLIYLLAQLHIQLRVFTRNQKDLAFLQSLGIPVYSGKLPSAEASDFRCIFNTVPAPILDTQTAGMLPDDCVYFELAGSPGGLLPGAAEALGARFIPLPGLPGKYAPEQAGFYYAQEVLRQLEEIL